MINSINLTDLDDNNGFVIKGIDEADLIISGLSADSNGNSNAGESYVVFGGSNVGSSSSLELSDLEALMAL